MQKFFFDPDGAIRSDVTVFTRQPHHTLDTDYELVLFTPTRNLRHDHRAAFVTCGLSQPRCNVYQIAVPQRWAHTVAPYHKMRTEQKPRDTADRAADCSSNKPGATETAVRHRYSACGSQKG